MTGYKRRKEIYREVADQLHPLAALPPGNYPCTHSIKGWVGHRVSLDVFGEN